ncbi:pre-mRNA-splicing factor CWC25 homolog [Heterodontus francisci]|uniref:pre-mRNA-splicing factor CWC25 homolog n=1 Tax=Heterodontus francisci TaxID=7792 RepID=UPI00355BA483
MPWSPPSADESVLFHVEQHLEEALRVARAQNVLQVGDFNVHHQEWLGSTISDQAGQVLKDIAARLGLQQVPPPEVPSITDASLQPIRFTLSDSKKQQKALKTAKAMGPDNILAKVLKTCAPEQMENLKKSWHPQTLKNVERVWKAEQKHEAEKKKIEELQRKLREERAHEEMQRYAEDSGALKKKSDQLDWMYQGTNSMVNKEEYLLGRPIDKYATDKMVDEEPGPLSDTGLLPGSIFSATGATSALDMASKIREDSLLMIRKCEEEKKMEVLTNPMKMKMIRQMGRHSG